MFFVILALLEAGDEAIYPESWFPDLRIDDQLHRRQSRAAPIREEKGFALDVDELAT